MPCTDLWHNNAARKSGDRGEQFHEHDYNSNGDGHDGDTSRGGISVQPVGRVVGEAVTRSATADYAGACHRAALGADPLGSSRPTGYGLQGATGNLSKRRRIDVY